MNNFTVAIKAMDNHESYVERTPALLASRNLPLSGSAPVDLVCRARRFGDSSATSHSERRVFTIDGSILENNYHSFQPMISHCMRYVFRSSVTGNGATEMVSEVSTLLETLTLGSQSSLLPERKG